MYYSIIGIVAIIINILINRDILIGKERSSETGAQTAYRFLNYGILAYLTTDVLWGICDASGSQFLLYADTVIYYIAMYVAVMLWARYVVRFLNDTGKFSRVLLIVVNILFVLEILVLLLNHFVHFFFWVDTEGHYHAYAFRYIALAIQIALFLITSWYAFSNQKKTEDVSLKNRYRTIGAFGITMAVSISVQMIYPLLPIYSIGYMIGTCLIHSFIIEDENAELRRRADEANRSKTSFLFNMSHDIRTPMNAILGYTQIGIKHIDDQSTTKDCFEKIKISGDHLLHLINDILEMSRIESGNLVLEEEPMNILEGIDKVRLMSESLAMSKSIDFTVSVRNIQNQYIYSDELHIDEVLINLISNAIKYTENGGHVCYTVEQISGVSDGKAMFSFEISDTGIGMSEEFQEHLFETFTREKNAAVSRTEGAGLGLSIVKKIVDLAGGTIEVKSRPGEGSTFTFKVPFRVMDEAAIEEYQKEKVLKTDLSQHIELRGKRVLLAEDNEMNMEIAVDLLKEAGFEVDTASDGRFAVDMVKQKGIDYYDIILMDIQMPIMNGYEATASIRNIPGSDNIPIIALSANAFAEDKAESIAAGMNAHIAKPINTTELIKVMSELLHSQQ